MADDRPVLRIGHSPDPDDAFMWWPLSEAGFDTGRFRLDPVADDIESLNRRAESGELEITALSCAQYARVRNRYALTACGASIGQQYGPSHDPSTALALACCQAPDPTRTITISANTLGTRRMNAGPVDFD